MRRRAWWAALAVALAVLPAGPVAGRAASLPGWLKDAIALRDQNLDPAAAAAVLLDEIAIEIGADGKQRMAHRYAVRIRKAEGAAAAMIGESYVAGTGRVKDINAWIVKPGGQTTELRRDSAVDLATDREGISEYRVQAIDASRDVSPGVVFGAEVTVEERTVFTQTLVDLQGEWPVVISRRSVKAPDGWRVTGITFNHAPIEPVVVGKATQWELRDLPGIVKEPAMPPVASLVPRLALGAVPPANSPIPALDSWLAVAKWLASVQDPPGEVTDTIRDRAAALTKEQPTLLGKIQSIGAFVQSVRYVSVQMGLSSGGGYVPKPAAEALLKNYGDCKDKANLMRALLAAAGIRSYLVGVYLGDASHVREEWPSPAQFNHAIVAVAVDASVAVPAVLTHARLGRLLIFDATNPYLPVGDLSDDLQGSLGLLVSVDENAVMRLPREAADRNLVERRWTGTLDILGTLTGTLTETSFGDEAADRRALIGLGTAKLTEVVERGISASVRGSKVESLTPTNVADHVELAVKFSAQRYAQAIQPTMWLVSPPGTAVDGPDLSASTRRSPIKLTASTEKETVTVELPSGFVVDELPSAATIDTTFGHFTTSARQDGPRVIIERVLSIQPQTIPADHAGEVRQFFEGVRAAHSSPIVIKSK